MIIDACQRSWQLGQFDTKWLDGPVLPMVVNYLAKPRIKEGAIVDGQHRVSFHRLRHEVSRRQKITKVETNTPSRTSERRSDQVFRPRRSRKMRGVSLRW